MKHGRRPRPSAPRSTRRRARRVSTCSSPSPATRPEPVGFALFFPIYSTFEAAWALYLEDLYVRPEARGTGAGLALLRAVAQEAVRRGAPRLDWVMLDWTRPAIGFYKRLGARAMSDWTGMRLSGDALAALGGWPASPACASSHRRRTRPRGTRGTGQTGHRCPASSRILNRMSREPVRRVAQRATYLVGS